MLKTIGGGLPPSERGGETYDWRAAALTLFVFVLIATCTMGCQDLTPCLAPSQHPCMQPHFTPASSPPTPLHFVAISILAINSLSGAYRWVSPQCSLRTARPSTSATRLGKVYKRALVVPPSSPHQRAFVCGPCIGTAQVGVSLVSLFDPIFKRFRFHCFDICLTWYLWHIKIWWQHLVPTYRVYTAPRYATIPKLTCWHVVSVLLYIWWSAPRYATIRILIWQHDVSVLLNIWWWCVNTSPNSGTTPTHCMHVVYVSVFF